MAVDEVLPKNLDLSKYVGQWVVICQDKIVAHNKRLSEVEKDIEKCRTRPIVAKIPKKDTLIF